MSTSIKTDEIQPVLEAIIECVKDGVLIAKAVPGKNDSAKGYEVILVNSPFEHITGYARKDIIGKAPLFVHGDHGFADLVEQGAKSGEIFDGEIGLQKKDGSALNVDMKIIPLANDKHEVSYVAAMTRETVINREIKAECEEALKKLKRSNKRAEAITRDMEDSLARIKSLEEESAMNSKKLERANKRAEAITRDMEDTLELLKNKSK